MNISSLVTRNNSHILLPDGGTPLQASDRACLLRKVRIRHGDAGGKADIGNLVIGTVLGGDQPNLTRVRKGRCYE
jgi:hypothetical protein